MRLSHQNSFASEQRFCIAHVSFIVSYAFASLVVSLLYIFWTWTTAEIHASSLQRATLSPISELSFAIFFYIISIFSGFFVFTILWYAIFLLGRALKIENVIYYILTAAFSFPLLFSVTALMQGQINITPQTRLFWQRYVAELCLKWPLFLFLGCAFGAIFYFANKKFWRAKL